MIPHSVTSIEAYAFNGSSSLTSIIIPDSVSDIGEGAFEGCLSLDSVYFSDNAPRILYDDAPELYDVAASTINYYLPGSTGRSGEYGGRPTALWLPKVLTDDPGFGVQKGQFGFTISWASDQVVVVEASSDLSSPDWSPVSTNSLIEGSIYFSDPDWTNHPARFYRLRVQ